MFSPRVLLLVGGTAAPPAALVHFWSPLGIVVSCLDFFFFLYLIPLSLLYFILILGSVLIYFTTALSFFTSGSSCRTGFVLRS